MPKVNLVGIQLKDLLLRKSPLNLHRQEHLLQLAAISLLRREKKIACQLHRQRRRTLRLPARMKIPVGSPHSSHQVYTPVALKTLVFNRDNRLSQNRWKLRIRQHHATLQRKGAKRLSMHIQELRR